MHEVNLIFFVVVGVNLIDEKPYSEPNSNTHS